MKTLIVIVLIMLIDYLIGCIILAYVDDENKSLFNWAKSNELMYVFVVMAWPIVLYFWNKRK